MSLDGRRLATAGYDTGIFISQPGPPLNLTLSNNLALTWPWPSPGYGLEQNTNLATATWVTVTNLPAFTNWQYQVTLTPTNGNHFFRLKSP
jgi:hypothetical protein